MTTNLDLARIFGLHLGQAQSTTTGQIVGYRTSRTRSGTLYLWERTANDGAERLELFGRASRSPMHAGINDLGKLFAIGLVTAEDRVPVLVQGRRHVRPQQLSADGIRIGGCGSGTWHQ